MVQDGVDDLSQIFTSKINLLFNRNISNPLAAHEAFYVTQNADMYIHRFFLFLSRSSNPVGVRNGRLPYESRHFGHLKLAITYALPFPKNTTQGRFTRLRSPTPTCRITTNDLASRLGKTTCMINLPPDFDGIFPYPIFFFLVPLAVESLLADRTGLIGEWACGGRNRGVGLRG
jgi:hypothetical protein